MWRQRKVCKWSSIRWTFLCVELALELSLQNWTMKKLPGTTLSSFYNGVARGEINFLYSNAFIFSVKILREKSWFASGNASSVEDVRRRVYWAVLAKRFFFFLLFSLQEGNLLKHETLKNNLDKCVQRTLIIAFVMYEQTSISSVYQSRKMLSVKMSSSFWSGVSGVR